MKIRLGLVAVCLFVVAGYVVWAQAPGPNRRGVHQDPLCEV